MARIQTELECTPTAVQAAREFIAAALEVWDLDELAAVATLLTSELVTNSILHARTAVRLVAERQSKELVVEVWDGSRELPTVVKSPMNGEAGRGLHLVDGLATRWGARREGSGKVVWFALAIAA